MRRKLSKHRCACCDRQLPEERYVFSPHTKARYCWPSEGCWRKRKGSRKAPRSLVSQPGREGAHRGEHDRGQED
jgi:hypothetical protein